MIGLFKKLKPISIKDMKKYLGPDLLRGLNISEGVSFDAKPEISLPVLEQPSVQVYENDNFENINFDSGSQFVQKLMNNGKSLSDSFNYLYVNPLKKMFSREMYAQSTKPLAQFEKKQKAEPSPRNRIQQLGDGIINIWNKAKEDANMVTDQLTMEIKAFPHRNRDLNDQINMEAKAVPYRTNSFLGKLKKGFLDYVDSVDNSYEQILMDAKAFPHKTRDLNDQWDMEAKALPYRMNSFLKKAKDAYDREMNALPGRFNDYLQSLEDSNNQLVMDTKSLPYKTKDLDEQIDMESKALSNRFKDYIESLNNSYYQTIMEAKASPGRLGELGDKLNRKFEELNKGLEDYSQSLSNSYNQLIMENKAFPHKTRDLRDQVNMEFEAFPHRLKDYNDSLVNSYHQLQMETKAFPHRTRDLKDQLGMEAQAFPHKFKAHLQDANEKWKTFLKNNQDLKEQTIKEFNALPYRLGNLEDKALKEWDDWLKGSNELPEQLKKEWQALPHRIRSLPENIKQGWDRTLKENDDVFEQMQTEMDALPNRYKEFERRNKDLFDQAEMEMSKFDNTKRGVLEQAKMEAKRLYNTNKDLIDQAGMETKRFINSNKDLFEQSKIELKNWVHNNRDIIEQAKMEYKRLPGAMKQGVRDVYYARQLPRDIIIGLIAEQNRKRAAEKGLDPREFPTMEQVIINNRNAHTRDYLLQDVLIQGGMDWKKAFALNAALDVSNLGETVIKGIVEKPEKTIPAGIKGFTAVYQFPLAGMKALTAASNRNMAKKFGYFDPKEHISGWEAFVDQMNPYQSPKYHLSAGLMQAMSTPPGAEKFPKIWYERLPENVKALIAASPEALLQLFYLQQMGKGLMHKARTRIPSRFNPTLPGSRYIDKAGKYLNQDAGKFAERVMNRMLGRGRGAFPKEISYDYQFEGNSKDDFRRYELKGVKKVLPELDKEPLAKNHYFRLKTGEHRPIKVIRYKNEKGEYIELDEIEKVISKLKRGHLQTVEEIYVTNSPLATGLETGGATPSGVLIRYSNNSSLIVVSTRVNGVVELGSSGEPIFGTSIRTTDELAGTIGHEIGHNVKNVFPGYQKHANGISSAFKTLSGRKDVYRIVVGRNPHLLQEKEFFAECFKFAVKTPKKLARVQEALDLMNSSVDLVGIFKDLLR